MQNNSPDFIGIGADHAGLGIITKFLSEHPGIATEIPTCRFFARADADTDEAIATYEACLPTPNKKHLVRGECSAEYLTTPGVAERIVTTYPTTQLFVVVRHPIDRAVAVYDQAKQNGRVAHGVSCAKYLLDHPTVQTDGFYGHHLSAYFSYYTSLQLYTIVYEDFAKDPLGVMQGLYAFLEVNATFIPKALASYAPPEDEPKHIGRIRRLVRFTKKALKKKFAKPVALITPPPYNFAQFFSPEELLIFKAAYVPDCAQLTNLLHRNMGVFWDLLPPVHDESPR